MTVKKVLKILFKRETIPMEVNFLFLKIHNQASLKPFLNFSYEKINGVGEGYKNMVRILYGEKYLKRICQFLLGKKFQWKKMTIILVDAYITQTTAYNAL